MPSTTTTVMPTNAPACSPAVSESSSITSATTCLAASSTWKNTGITGTVPLNANVRCNNNATPQLKLVVPATGNTYTLQYKC